LVPGSLILVVLFEPQPEIPRVSVVALFADGFQVDLVELGLDGHLLVAGRAGKVVDAPGLIEGGEDVALDHLVAHVAKVTEQLVVVGLAVGQTLSLVVAVTQEWLLALCTYEVFNVPVFSKSGDDAFLYRPPAGATNRDAHFVMAPEAIEFVQLVGSVARPGPDLPSSRCQLTAAPGAVEMVGVVNFPAETQRVSVNDRAGSRFSRLKFGAKILMDAFCFHFLFLRASLKLESARA